jgi:hypothetical protein
LRIDSGIDSGIDSNERRAGNACPQRRERRQPRRGGRSSRLLKPVRGAQSGPALGAVAAGSSAHVCAAGIGASNGTLLTLNASSASGPFASVRTVLASSAAWWWRCGAARMKVAEGREHMRLCDGGRAPPAQILEHQRGGRLVNVGRANRAEGRHRGALQRQHDRQQAQHDGAGEARRESGDERRGHERHGVVAMGLLLSTQLPLIRIHRRRIRPG